VVEIREINRSISLGLLDLAAFSKDRNIVIKREQEKKGTLYLLSRLLGTEPQLRYTNENKPFISGNPCHISISHSHDKLAIIMNRDEATGVDIELIREKVLRVRHKFLNPREQAFAGDNIARLITLWGAKEAIYKAYGLKDVEFSKQILIEPFTGEELVGSIKTRKTQKKYLMRSEKIGDYILVYTMNEI
jgi:4'-phosphopantetheinyl transferase